MKHMPLWLILVSCPLITACGMFSGDDLVVKATDLSNSDHPVKALEYLNADILVKLFYPSDFSVERVGNRVVIHKGFPQSEFMVERLESSNMVKTLQDLKEFARILSGNQTDWKESDHWRDLYGIMSFYNTDNDFHIEEFFLMDSQSRIYHIKFTIYQNLDLPSINMIKDSLRLAFIN